MPEPKTSRTISPPVLQSAPEVVGEKLPKLTTFPAKDIAEELTLLDARLLRMIKTSELENGAWMKKDKKEKLAPNVMAMVRSFNRVALLIPTEILAEETPQARAKVISTYIKIAQECYCHRNYNSLKAVLAGLQSTPVYRLTKTWKEVSSRKKKRFDQLALLMREDNNWSTYNQELERHLKTNTSFIPFLGVFLTATAFFQTAVSKHHEVRSNSVCAVPQERKLSSEMYETYHLLEAITVRQRLDKLRENSFAQDSDGDEGTPRPVPRHISTLTLSALPSSSPSTKGHSTIRTDLTHIKRESPLCMATEFEAIYEFSDDTLTETNSTDGTMQSRHQLKGNGYLPGSDSDVTLNGVNSDSYHDTVNTTGEVNGICEVMTQNSSSSTGSESFSTPRKGPAEKRRLFATKKSTERAECNIVEDVCVELPSGTGFKLLGSSSKKPRVGEDVGISKSRAKKDLNRSRPEDRGVRNRVTPTGTPSTSTHHDRRKLWQGKSREMSMSLSSSFSKGALTKSVGGSLECLLDAVETELPSERKEKEIDYLPRSPSLCALNSLDVLEGGETDTLSSVYNDPTTVESDSDTPSTLGENSDWSSQIDTQLSLPSSLNTAKSCEDILNESLSSSGRGLSVGGGEDLLTGHFKSLAKGGAGGRSLVNGVAEPGPLDASVSSSSVESNQNSSHSRFRLPTFARHRRNSSHPNFSFNTVSKNSSETSTSPTPTTSHTPSSHTSSSSSSTKSPPCSTGPFHKKIPFLLRGGAPKSSSTPHKASSAPLRRRQHHLDVIPRLRAAKIEGSVEPGDLLHQYQFMSLGCCAQIESYPLLRQVLTQRDHNTEAANYKLSYQREPL